MNYQQTLAYNQRWFSLPLATKFAMGRHRIVNGAATMANIGTRGGDLYPQFPKSQLDRYDWGEEIIQRRTWHADMAALRYGVSTREQRQRLCNMPHYPRGHRGLRPGALRSAADEVRTMNRVAREEIFCIPERSAQHLVNVFDQQLALVEDLRVLYDGARGYAHNTITSPYFPDLLFNRHDSTLCECVVKIDRGRYVTARVPRKMAEQHGARSLLDVIREEEGQTIARQLMDRISLSRGSNINLGTAYVLPLVLETHPRLFKAEFLRINYGRAPGEYHSSGRYLRGEDDGTGATLGLEWEVGIPNTRRTIIANRVQNAFSKAAGTMDYIHAERDGSLNGRGVEFVFAYRSLDKHRQIIRDAFESDGSLPQRNRTLSTRLTRLDEAGIHVHIGTVDERGQIRDHATWARMNNVLNSVKNRDFIQALVGRKGNGHYVRYDDQLINPASARDGLYTLQSSRYKVLNYRGSTVEIRAFASGTTAEWLMMTLEFADALLKYSSHDHGMPWTQHANAHNFVEWVMGCEDCYPNLVNRIREPVIMDELMSILPEGTPEFRLPLNPRPGTPQLPPRRTEADLVEAIRTGRITGESITIGTGSGMTEMTVDELLSDLGISDGTPVHGYDTNGPIRNTPRGVVSSTSPRRRVRAG